MHENPPQQITTFLPKLARHHSQMAVPHAVPMACAKSLLSPVTAEPLPQASHLKGATFGLRAWGLGIRALGTQALGIRGFRPRSMSNYARFIFGGLAFRVAPHRCALPPSSSMSPPPAVCRTPGSLPVISQRWPGHLCRWGQCPCRLFWLMRCGAFWFHRCSRYHQATSRTASLT